MKNEIKKFECAVLSALGMIVSVIGGNVATMLTYVGLALLLASATLYYRRVPGSEYLPFGFFGTWKGSVRMMLHKGWFFKRFTKVW